MGDYGSYFSVAWFSKFIYSPTNAYPTQATAEALLDVDKQDKNLSTSKERSYPDNSNHATASSPMRSKLDSQLLMKSQESCVTPVRNNEGICDLEINPLLEAKEVKKRMDTLSSVIKSGIKKNKRNITPATSKKRLLDDRILEKIDIQTRDSNLTIDHKHPGMPSTRQIILEELGTASSWIILLLPYIAFFVALLLDSDSKFWHHTSDALSAKQSCSLSNTVSNVPLMPLPGNPCWYDYHLMEREGLLSFVKRFGITTESYLVQMGSGVAITTGPLKEVPALTTYLLADIKFKDLSAASVSLVSEGNVYFSSVVMQKERNTSPHSNWYPILVSKPTELAMVCDNEKDDLNWSCISPRNVDIRFTLPGTTILTGGTIRIDSILTYDENITVDKVPNASNVLSNITALATSTKVYSKHATDEENLSNADLSDPRKLLSEIAQSSSYYVSYRNPRQNEVLIAVRIGTLVLSCMFILFWLWSMGIDGFFGIQTGACCCLFVRKCHHVEPCNGTIYKFVRAFISRIVFTHQISIRLNILSFQRIAIILVGKSLGCFSRAKISVAYDVFTIIGSKPSDGVHVFSTFIIWEFSYAYHC